MMRGPIMVFRILLMPHRRLLAGRVGARGAMHAGILPVRLALCAVISRHPANL